MNCTGHQEPCLLCGSAENDFFFEDKRRLYLRCSVCSVIFVPPEFHVSPESERARYEEHNNDPDDIRYRKFLERITVPIQKRFEKGSQGLDFGCGPTPLLGAILREQGFDMKVYDPFYADDRKVLDSKYDFVVTTEVVEHLARPLTEFKRLFSLVKRDGILAVMTRPYDDSIDFKGWHYKNDRTHICFFTSETFDWIAVEFGETYIREESDIFVFDRRRNT